MEIQSCVSSIVAAFISLNEVLTRCRGRAAASSQRLDGRRRNAEQRLQKTLKQAPKAISVEFERGFSTHGSRFQRGDGKIIQNCTLQECNHD